MADNLDWLRAYKPIEDEPESQPLDLDWLKAYKPVDDEPNAAFTKAQALRDDPNTVTPLMQKFPNAGLKPYNPPDSYYTPDPIKKAKADAKADLLMQEGNVIRGKGDYGPAETTFGDYAGEALKGVPRGAISATGQMVRGAATMQTSLPEDVDEAISGMERFPQMTQRERIQWFDKARGVFKGEARELFADIYNNKLRVKRPVTPEDIAALRAKTPQMRVEETPAFKLGKDIETFGREALPQDPQFKDSWTSTLSEGAGSTAPYLLAGVLPGGAALGAAAGVMGSSGEATDTAIQKGATQRQIMEAARLGVMPGLTEQIPIEIMLRRVPAGIRSKLVRAIYKGAEQAAVEGGQEGMAQFGQNLIEKYTYNPDKDVMEDVWEQAGIGAIIGGGMGAAVSPFQSEGEAAPTPPGGAAQNPAVRKEPRLLPAPEPTSALKEDFQAQPPADPAAAMRDVAEMIGATARRQAAYAPPAKRDEDIVVLRQIGYALEQVDDMSAAEVSRRAQEARGAGVALSAPQTPAALSAPSVAAPAPPNAAPNIPQNIPAPVPGSAPWAPRQQFPPQFLNPVTGQPGVPTPMEQDVAAQQAPPQITGPQTFTTAKGSTYTVHEDGTTTRTKAQRAEHGTDHGLKPRTAVTVYVDPAEVDRLALPDSGWRVDVNGDKASVVTWNEAENRWGISPTQRDVPVTTTPAVGLTPLELWTPEDAPTGRPFYKKAHFGNPIIEVGGSSPLRPVAPEEVQALGLEAAQPPEKVERREFAGMMRPRPQRQPHPRAYKGFTYYSSLRPIGSGFPVKGDVDPDSDQRIIRTEQPISPAEMVRMELTPFSRDAKVAAVKAAYQQEEGATEGTFELRNPEKGFALALVSQDPQSGNWRMTRFDEYGPSGHMEENSLDEAIASAVNEGFVEPAAGTLDSVEFLDMPTPPSAAPPAPAVAPEAPTPAPAQMPASEAPSATQTPFEKAKAKRDELEAADSETGKALKALSGGGLMGMTPDAVRATPEWKAAKDAYDTARSRLQKFNARFTKTFKTELAEERRNRKPASEAPAGAQPAMSIFPPNKAVEKIDKRVADAVADHDTTPSEPQAPLPSTEKQQARLSEYLSGTAPLDPQRLAKRLNTTPKEATRLLAQEAAAGRVRYTRTGRFLRVPKREQKPVSLVEFLIDGGGIRLEGTRGNLKAQDLDKVSVRFRGKLVTKAGMSLHEAMERAVAAGYIGQQDRYNPDAEATVTTDDLIEALRQENFGDKVYSDDDAGLVEAQAQKAAAAKAKDELETRYEPEQRAFIEKYGVPLLEFLEAQGMRERDFTGPALERAKDLIDRGMKPADALESAVMDEHNDEDAYEDREADAAADSEEVPFAREKVRESPKGQGEPRAEPVAARSGVEPAQPRADQAAARAREPEVERTAAGQQAVLPGAERVGQKTQAQRAADAPLKGRVAQKLTMDEGLFGDEKDQFDLLDMAPKGRSQQSARERPVFFSALVRAVEGMKQPKAPAKQWAATIERLPGVKPEELEWTGLLDWLKAQDGTLTKEQVADFVRANQIEVKEVTKGEVSSKPTRRDDVRPTDSAAAPFLDEWNANVREANEIVMEMGGRPPRERQDELRQQLDEITARREAIHERMVDATIEEMGGLGTDGPKTKFESYALPGATNYRELLLTLPPIAAKDIDAKIAETLRQDNALMAELGGSTPERKAQIEESIRSNSAERRRLEGVRRERKIADYKSSHWDEPNVLAHVRLNERTDADGKRVLVVEEAQSDFAQDVRRQRQKVAEAIDRDFDAIAAKMVEAGVIQKECD